MDERDEAEPRTSPPPAGTNLADLVSWQAARRPDREALVEPVVGERRALTWAELEAQVESLAAGLTGLGLVAGQRLGVLGENSAAWLISWLAALRAGLVVVPVNPDAAEGDIATLLEECGVHALLSADAPRTYPNVSTRPLTAAGLAEIAGDAAATPVVSPPDAEALAVLLSTAGTSGAPKIAMLSHRALLAAAAVDQPGVPGPEAVVLAAVPLCHAFGLTAVVTGWLAGGSRLVVAPGGREDLLEVIELEHVSELPLTPSLLHRLSLGLAPGPGERPAGRLGSLRRLLSGAAPLPAGLRRDLTERTGHRVEVGYGVTEAAGSVAATMGGELRGPAHVGRPLPGVEVRIGTGPDVGEPGPIWIRGDNLFSGYWPDASGGPDSDGWFDTGDVGYRTGTDLFLLDRVRELVVVNGFTVYPLEVEQVLTEQEGVRAAAAVGVPDPRSGERIVAFAVVDGLTADALAEHCAARLAPFKRPAEIVLVEELPRGVSGKVRRSQLRRRLAAPAGSPP